MAEKKEKKEKKKLRFEIVDVPTQTTPVIKDNSSDNFYNELTGIAEILNKLEKIEKELE